MWWNTRKSSAFKRIVELSMEMARDGSSSHKRTGSNSSVTKRPKDDKAGPSGRRSRDKKGPKVSHTVNIADKHKSNNKNTVVPPNNNVKITPAKVVAARNQRLKAKPINQVESSVEVSALEKRHLEAMGFILSNVLGKDEGCIKFRAHFLVAKNTGLLRQKHHLWCKVIEASNSNLIEDLKSRELKMLSKLKHTNVAELHGLVHLNGKIFLFTTGGMYGNVMDFLANYGPLIENHGRVWFRQIVNGLDFLHSNNIAHNDLNCETLLLSNRYNILISDFSSACYLSKDGLKTLSDITNQSLYSAPEVLLGDEYNPKLAEMWSLGVILYAFYMGNPPFRYYGNDDEQLAKLVVDQIQRVWLCKKGETRKLSHRTWKVICALLEPNFMKRAQMRHLKNSEFYIMRECVCGHGSYKAMCQEILGSLPDLYTSAKPLSKWGPEVKNDSKTKVVCPAFRQFFSPRKDLMLKIEDAEPPPAPKPTPDIVINIDD